MSVLKSRKARAVLAGGVVLGIGASMTLAAWSDSEWATGTFSTGGFTFQGSTDGTTYADHATSGTAASLAFTLTPEAMQPGDTVEAPFWIKTNGPAAKVTLNAPQITTTNALSQALTVDVVDGACSSTTSIVSGGLDDVAATTLSGTVNDTARQVCFKVTLPSTYAEAAELSTDAVSWEFAATTDGV